MGSRKRALSCCDSVPSTQPGCATTRLLYTPTYVVSFAARVSFTRRGTNTSWSSSTAQSTPSQNALVASR